MKARIPLAAMALLMLSQIHAQTTPAKPVQPALPPPGLTDPGVTPMPDAAHASSAAMTQSTPAEMTPTRLPGKPIPLPREPGTSGPPDTVPDVQIREEEDRTVEEYRRSGRLYMVVVTPKNGVPQTYMVDPQGKLHGDNGKPPVEPVMYKVMEWGKAPKPVDAQDDTSSGQ